MKHTARLLILLASAVVLEGCVVVTFTGEGAERIPTSDVPAHLASALGLSGASADQPVTRRATK